MALLYFHCTFATHRSFSPSLSFTTTHGARLTIPFFFSSFLSSLISLTQVSLFYHDQLVMFHFGLHHSLESNPVSPCRNPFSFSFSSPPFFFFIAQCLSTCLLTWPLLPPSSPVAHPLLVPCTSHHPQISFHFPST